MTDKATNDSLQNDRGREKSMEKSIMRNYARAHILADAAVTQLLQALVRRLPK